ncbi:MAG TPA: hypothetical protein VGZ52_01190, partial [Acidimicrobiales bacterium]|nr:hypothetical protein [Acidimicrobiales bacterium]
MNNPRPDQVAVCVLLVAALAVALPNVPEVVSIPAGLVLLTLPAYWMSQVLLPVLAPSSAERVLATLTLTVVSVILAALALYSAGVRLTHVSWAVTLAALGLVGWWAAGRGGARRTDRQPAERPAWPTRFGLRRRQIVLLALAAVVLTGTAVLARLPLKPPPGVAGYTQLWLIPQPTGFQLGVACFELQPTHYRVELVADGTVVRTLDDIALDPNHEYLENVTLTGSFLEARLYQKNSGSRDPYRIVHIGTASTTTAPAASAP